MEHHIVCTEQQPIYHPATHAHIVAVGIDHDQDGRADAREALGTVVAKIDAGHRYYTVGSLSGKKTYVEVVWCPRHCNERIIRSMADAVTDNNLDSLRRCSRR